MIIKAITYNDDLWESVSHYAETCSWGAGQNLSKQMKSNEFSDWERVFVALEDNYIVGYCTIAKIDCIPDIKYTPYIGYIFVNEHYRGNRLSQKLIGSVIEYAKQLKFDKVYIVSDHINLYEKYGFIKIDEKPAPWNQNTMESIFMYII